MINRNTIEPTVILNKENLDGFLDFNCSEDLSEVIRTLNKLMKEDDCDE